MLANQLLLRLDWSEMDLFGHINNVSYFKYLQASRVNLWEHTEMDAYFTHHRLGPALAKTECTFLKPLFYPGTIKIDCFVKQIRTTSFQLHHFIYDASGELCAEGEDVIVFFDYSNHKKVPLTKELIAQLEQYMLPPKHT